MTKSTRDMWGNDGQGWKAQANPDFNQSHAPKEHQRRNSWPPASRPRNLRPDESAPPPSPTKTLAKSHGGWWEKGPNRAPPPPTHRLEEGAEVCLLGWYWLHDFATAKVAKSKTWPQWHRQFQRIEGHLQRDLKGGSLDC